MLAAMVHDFQNYRKISNVCRVFTMYQTNSIYEDYLLCLQRTSDTKRPFRPSPVAEHAVPSVAASFFDRMRTAARVGMMGRPRAQPSADASKKDNFYFVLVGGGYGGTDAYAAGRVFSHPGRVFRHGTGHHRHGFGLAFRRAALGVARGCGRMPDGAGGGRLAGSDLRVHL